MCPCSYFSASHLPDPHPTSKILVSILSEIESKIKYLWPNSSVYGIEIVERIAQIGANYLNIIPGNIESMELPYAIEQLDYIILAAVIEHLHNPEETLVRLIPYLKKRFIFVQYP